VVGPLTVVAMAASLVHLLLSWGISVAEGVPRRSEKEGARRTVATRGTAGCRRKAALAAPGAAVCVPLAALLVADDCGDLRQLRGCPHPAPAPRGAERRCGRIGVVAINDWWSADPAERFWMETTGRNDLGAELHAPQLNGAGRREWGYALVAETRPGDVVFHWHKSLAGRPALVGWSTITGPLSVDQNYSWMPKGTRGRARGVPTVGRGWRMPCTDFTALQRPIDGAALAAQEDALKVVADQVKDRAYGATYFPFAFYRPGEIRSSQSYLTKFPAALLGVFPELTSTQSATTPPLKEVRVPLDARSRPSTAPGRSPSCRSSCSGCSSCCRDRPRRLSCRVIDVTLQRALAAPD
jgi:hypothetical protein